MQTKPKKSVPSRFWHVFAAPLVIGLVSIAGLLSALIGDHIFDVASWIGLGAPSILICWYAFRRR
ncbi:MAG: hypothetical protein V4441_08155 [Pseudomonadota bacterium]